MTPRAQLVSIALAAAVFLAIVWLVRRGSLKERFAILWLTIGTGLIVLAAVPPWLDSLSELLGIRSGTTTLFLAATLFLLGLIMHLSVNLSRIQEDLRDLAEAIALHQADHEDRETASPADGRPGEG